MARLDDDEAAGRRGDRSRALRFVVVAIVLGGVAVTLSAAGSGPDAPDWLGSERTREAVVADGGRTVGYVSTEAMMAPPVVVNGQIQTGTRELPVYDLGGNRVGDLGPHGFVPVGGIPADSAPTTTSTR